MASLSTKGSFLKFYSWLPILILYFEHQHDFFISCKKEEEENGTWKCIPFAF